MSTPKTPATDSADRRRRLDSQFGEPTLKQLNVRVPAGLAENLRVVSKLTDETVADIVTAALQAAVSERLARPEIQALLESLLAEAQQATLSPAR